VEHGAVWLDADADVAELVDGGVEREVHLLVSVRVPADIRDDRPGRCTSSRMRRASLAGHASGPMHTDWAGPLAGEAEHRGRYAGVGDVDGMRVLGIRVALPRARVPATSPYCAVSQTQSQRVDCSQTCPRLRRVMFVTHQILTDTHGHAYTWIYTRDNARDGLGEV
jgi:hypothetical protein